MVEEVIKLDFSDVPKDPESSTKFVVKLLLRDICPLILQLRSKLPSNNDDENTKKLRDVFTLCSSQIKKCILNLLEVFKLEYEKNICLQECRQCNFERLAWCFNRLISVKQHVSRDLPADKDESVNDTMMVTVMYFVNWIDHTFELLNKLAYLIYKTDYKETEALYDSWKNDMVECLCSLHVAIEELLLSAMTLCRYSIPGDQVIVKARCQVVMRETKALLSEVIEGDLNSTVQATPDTLKLPIKPSNVNILIDVLKDVLYVLETNTNTALLALLIHSFSNNVSPVDVLKEHFANNATGTCSCIMKSEHEITEDCPFVKDFDLYNERLLQIGSFAVSCSSDQSRILSLRSGLASLEALDPHLVPALMTSPKSYHSKVLMNLWRQEVQDIRDSVFLIVDPAAFAEKAKQMMQQKLLEVLNKHVYCNDLVCSVINVGCVVHDFFYVYKKYEPDALTQHEKLLPLLADLEKVQKECKIVSNLLCTEGDFVYNVKVPSNKPISLEQLVKRLKLLYTLVNRINGLLHPKETDDQSFGEEDPIVNNATQTVCQKGKTYINSPRKVANNMTRSVFVRTTNIRCSTRNFPLSNLTKHLRTNQVNELSFSVQLDKMFNLSGVNEKQINRSSLRKAVLDKYCHMTCEEVAEPVHEANTVSDTGGIMDESTSFQIMDVLNQLSDLTNILSATNPTQNSSRTHTYLNQDLFTEKCNKLTLTINHQNTPVSKRVWSIPVCPSSSETKREDAAHMTNISSLTQPSNFNTLERISDLNYVETKLCNLKSQFETTL